MTTASRRVGRPCAPKVAGPRRRRQRASCLPAPCAGRKVVPSPAPHRRAAAMSARPLVVITDHLAEAGVERGVLDPVADVRLLQTDDEAEVERSAADADALLAFHAIKLTARSLSVLTRCRGVVR